MSIEHGTGGDRYTNVKTEDGTFQTVFTADSVTPGKYQITAQIKYTDPDKVEVDASLSKAAEFVPAAPTITSEASYTDGTDYTLTWTDDVAYADNTSISYYVAYWGIPEGEEEADWIPLAPVNEKQYKLSAEMLAQYGKQYAVRTIAKVGEETIAGGYDDIELTAVPGNVVITVPDVQQENAGGTTTVKATFSIPEGAEINNVWLKNDDLNVNQEVSSVADEPNTYSFTGSLNASDNYYIEAWINGVKFTQGFKITKFVPEVTVEITAAAFGENITATFTNLPEGVQQVCINVQDAAGNKHKDYPPVEEDATAFTTTDAAVNALFKTPGQYTIIASYQGSDGAWYYPETTNNLRLEVALEVPQVSASGTYIPGEDYKLT